MTRSGSGFGAGSLFVTFVLREGADVFGGTTQCLIMVRNHSGGLPDEMGGYKLTRIAPNALPDRYVFTNDIL